MSNRGKKLKIFTLLALTMVLGFSCTPVSGLYVWDVNDPNSCPLEAEIRESIIIRGNPPPQYNVVRDPYNATDEQKQLCSELRGSDITMGEFLRIVYPHLWNGLSPEDQKMYDSYKKAWGAVDPIPLPPWHEPGEAAPSGDDTNQLNVEERPEYSGYPLIDENPLLSGIQSTSSFRQYNLTQLQKSYGESIFLTVRELVSGNLQGSLAARFPQFIITDDDEQSSQQIGNNFATLKGDLIRNHMAG